MKRVIIDSETIPKISDRISLYSEKLPITFAAVGLSAGEIITIEILVNNVWEALYVSGGAITLTSTNKVVSVYSPVSIRLVKGTTLNPVSVEMFSQNIEPLS